MERIYGGVGEMRFKKRSFVNYFREVGIRGD